MNQLSIQKRVAILTCLSEGMGINATARTTETSKNTVLKLLCDVGAACAAYQDRAMNNLRCTRIQCDEIWSFVGAKQANVRKNDERHTEYGDVYTFTAMDPDSKLMPCWFVGQRSTASAVEFMEDLAPRLANRIQLSTDGFQGYDYAVQCGFKGNVDYGMLNKSYKGEGNLVEAKRRYSPAPLAKAEKMVRSGNPDPKHISTSHVERANLSMRMGMRRFTRLTNAFSRKLENHMAAVSFYFMVYNFVKIHSSIKTTPAMEAGVTDFLWSMEDIVLMAETNG